MCIIAMKNMTNAQRARKALNAAGINSSIVGLEGSLTRNGCAYGLSIDCTSVGRAVAVMRQKRVIFGEIIGG